MQRPKSPLTPSPVNRALNLYLDLVKLYIKLEDDELSEAIEERICEEFDRKTDAGLDELKEQLNELLQRK